MEVMAMRNFMTKPIMQRCFSSENKMSRYIAIGAVVVVGTFKLVSYIRRRNRRKRWNNVTRNVVVLHMIPRGVFAPNLSPFVLKLETYLRMALIPYEIDYEEPIGPKGKCPWITLNGEEIGDSQLIMEKLGPIYGKDFSAHLTPEQKAVGLSMRVMAEEHLYWCLAIWGFITDDCRTLKQTANIPPFVQLLMLGFKRKVRHATYLQGMGLHSTEDVEEFGRKDLSALSTWLGEKPFFMGEKPTEFDCAMFGILGQIQWNSPGSPYLLMIERDFKNLSAFCFRVKEKFWPDWNRCLNPPRI